jgi:hypothetical protein
MQATGGLKGGKAVNEGLKRVACPVGQSARCFEGNKVERKNDWLMGQKICPYTRLVRGH